MHIFFKFYYGKNYKIDSTANANIDKKKSLITFWLDILAWINQTCCGCRWQGIFPGALGMSATAFVSVGWGGQRQADLEGKCWGRADDGRLTDASLTSQLNHLQTKSQGRAGSAASDRMKCVSLVEGHWFMGCWSSEADGTDPTAT